MKHLHRIATALDPALPVVRGGEVWLVGAGPGDPGLLTVKGRAVLEQADVVVHDRLGCEEILHGLPRGIRRIDVGKLPGRAKISQQGIQEILLREAREGNAVVRLKGGDPFVFGRGMEEMIYLAEEGVRCHAIPGISSAVAGPAAAGIPVTHRTLARGFRVATGRTEEGAVPQLGRDETRVFLMSVGSAPEIVAQLLAEGFSEATPTATVSNATTYRQRVLKATLGTLIEELQSRNIEPPAVLVVGETARFAAENRDVYTVLVTGSRVPPLLQEWWMAQGRDEELRTVLRPLSRVEPLDAAARDEVRAQVFESLEADWLLFNNPHSAREYFDLLNSFGLDARRVRASIAAVGQETASTLAERGIVADLTAVDGRIDGLLDALGPQLGKTTVAVPCALDYKGELGKGLQTLGVREVRMLPVYRSVANEMGEIDWDHIDAVLLVSPGAAERFFQGSAGGDGHVQDTGGAPVLLCVGASTAARAREHSSNVVMLTPEAVSDAAAELA